MTNLTDQKFYQTVVSLLETAEDNIQNTLKKMQESPLLAYEMEWADDLFAAAAVQKLMQQAKRFIENGNIQDGKGVYNFLVESALSDTTMPASTSQSSNLMNSKLHFEAIRIASRFFARYND